MDPVTLGLGASALGGGGGFLGTLGTVATIGGTLFSAVAESQAMKAQAKQEQQRAEIEANNAEIRAKETRALGQQKAGVRMREARLAQSRLKAASGASGSSSSDPTVLNLWEGIQEEGQHNADQETAAADSRASGIEYQSDLNSWTADSNARIKRAGATSTLIGGFGSALGGLSRMKTRYGGYSSGTTRAYG